MTICQICGDRGYSKLLTHCVQCQNIAAHRYCVLGPPIFEDEDFNWSCEFCEPDKNQIESTTPSRNVEDLCSTVEQVALQIIAQEKSPSLPQSETSNVAPKEMVKGDDGKSVLHQKDKVESVTSNKVELIENGSPLLPHVSDATEVMPVNYIEKGDKSYTDVNEAATTAASGNSEGLSLSGDQVVLGLSRSMAGKMCRSSLSPRQSVNLNVDPKKIVKGDTDLSILHQRNKNGSVRRKKVKFKENGSPVLPHVSDATEVMPVPNVEKGDKLYSNVNKGETMTPSRNREGLSSSVDQVIQGLPARKKCVDNLSLPQSENSNAALKENVKGDTDLSLLHQTSKGGSVIRKDKVIQGPTSRKCVNKSYRKVSECNKELSPGEKHSGQLNRPADANNGEEIKNLISDNGVKKANIKDVKVTEQKIKKVKSSDHQQVNRGKNVTALLSKVEDHVREIACTARDGIQRDSRLVKQNKYTENDIKKSTILDDERRYGATTVDKPSKVHSERSEELADNGRNKKCGVDVKSIRDVYEHEGPRKKRKFVIEVEFSDEEPVFVVAKHPHRVADVGKDPSKSSSEANSKLSVDGFSRFSSVESIPPRPYPMQVNHPEFSGELSVVFDNHIPGQPPPLTMVNYVSAQPLIDPAWRGYCSIADDGEYPMSLALEVHLSNKAHEKVQGAVSVLPESLNFDLVPKKYAWPRTYEESPPTGDEVGLYLFAVDERAKKIYDSIVNQMMMDDLALKSIVNNLELLVFSSTELPREEWRLLKKYYLWGVFKPRKDLFVPREIIYQQYDPPSPVDQVYYPPAMSNDPSNCHALYDPSCRTTSFSNTHFHEEAVGPSVELARSIPKPLDRGYDIEEKSFHRKPNRDRDGYMEDYDRDSRRYRQFPDREHSRDAESSDQLNHLASVESPRSIPNPLDRGYDIEEQCFHCIPNRDRDDYTEDYDRDSRRCRQFQDHEHSRDAESSDHTRGNHSYRARSDRWDKRPRKWKDRDWNKSRRSHQSYRF